MQIRICKVNEMTNDVEVDVTKIKKIFKGKYEMEVKGQTMEYFAWFKE